MFIDDDYEKYFSALHLSFSFRPLSSDDYTIKKNNLK